MDDAIVYLNSSNAEAFSITPHLRYLQLEEKVILQQMWQGNKGTEKWENVPTIQYDDK